MNWGCGEHKVCGARSRSLKCITDARLESTSSSTDGFQRHPQTLCSSPPQGQVFAGTKDSRPSVSAPSAGLRPLIVSHVKCGGGPCRRHSVLPYRRNQFRRGHVGQPVTIRTFMSREVFSCVFCTKIPSYTARNCSFCSFCASRSVLLFTAYRFWYDVNNKPAGAWRGPSRA